MRKKKLFISLYYLPIIISILIPTSFLITYIIALCRDDLVFTVPYISEAAEYPPESWIFGQFLNLIAILLFFLVYCRYYQIDEYLESLKLSNSLLRWNFLGLIFGIVSSLGMSAVGNFPDNPAHLTGAVLCFGGATLYFWSQTICSCYLRPRACSRKLVYFRIALSVICTLLTITVGVTMTIERSASEGVRRLDITARNKTKDLHLVSAIMEYSLSFVMSIFVLSFKTEFEDCKLLRPQIILLDRCMQSP